MLVKVTCETCRGSGTWEVYYGYERCRSCKGKGTKTMEVENNAFVAELVDAAGLGPAVLTGVGVRVPPDAPNKEDNN